MLAGEVSNLVLQRDVDGAPFQRVDVSGKQLFVVPVRCVFGGAAEVLGALFEFTMQE